MADAVWKPSAEPGAPADAASVESAIHAAQPAHVDAFRALLVDARPNWLAAHQASAFVDVVEARDASLGATLRKELKGRLEAAFACATDPGGRTRLRRQIAEIEIADVVGAAAGAPTP